MSNSSNIPYDFLTINRSYLEEKAGPYPSTGFPIILLLYSVLIPIFILCWVSTIRFLRNRGYITRVQENEIISSIPLMSRDSKVGIVHV